MPLDGRHGQYVADTMREASVIARQTEWERCGLLSMLLGDMVATFGVADGNEMVLAENVRRQGTVQLDA